MNVCIAEFPDDPARQAAAWETLIGHVAATQPELVVLPEMPFCEWIFVGDIVEPVRWREAINRHDRMIARLGELGAPWVVSSRPVDHAGQRFNEAYLWSAAIGYQPLRRKWYLPDAPRAKETVWFDQQPWRRGVCSASTSAPCLIAAQQGAAHSPSRLGWRLRR
jgi:N-carbamoylputrescine amidase